MYDRFFAFGCSHTNYFWSSWADIIATDLKIPYYNYALPGLGNVGIMHEIVAADLEHTFTKNDLIIIMWSHWSREDRYVDTGWKTQGSIFNSSFYDKRFIKKYWSFANDIVKNATAIISVNKMYNEVISHQSHIMNPGMHERIDEAPARTYTEEQLIKKYSKHLPNCPTLDNFTSYSFDCHPDVLGHLNFVTEYMYPSVGLELQETTKKHYYLEHRKLLKLKNIKQLPTLNKPVNLAG